MPSCCECATFSSARPTRLLWSTAVVDCAFALALAFPLAHVRPSFLALAFALALAHVHPSLASALAAVRNEHCLELMCTAIFGVDCALLGEALSTKVIVRAILALEAKSLDGALVATVACDACMN